MAGRMTFAAVAVWLATAVQASAFPDHDVKLICSGGSSRGGYPFGVQEFKSEMTLLIAADGEITSDSENIREKICRNSPDCKVSRKDGKFSVLYANIPGYLAYAEHFDLDFNTGEVSYGGGGIDGGWGFQGTCRPAAQ